MINLAKEPPIEFMEDVSLKEFTIKGQDDFEYKFKYKPLDWYEEEKLFNEMTEINPFTKKVSINIPELTMQSLLRTLKEAPFEISKENITKLKRNIVEQIMEIVGPKRMTEEMSKKSTGQ